MKKRELRRALKDCDRTVAQLAAECERLDNENAELRKRITELESLTEIGRLVRGMQPDTRLEKWERYYAAVVFDNRSPYMFGLTDDPAEALRAIQEEAIDDSSLS